MASFRHFNKYVPIIVDITNARYVPKIDDPKLGPEELQFNYSRVAYDTRRSLWVVGIEGHDEFTEIPQEKDEEHYINYVSFSLSNPDLERIVGRDPKGNSVFFLKKFLEEKEAYFDPFGKKWVYKNHQTLPDDFKNKMDRHLLFTFEDSIRDVSPRLKPNHAHALAIDIVNDFLKPSKK
ncbi:hypothetical protein J4466_03835 [Candidatus Pacearchaeota archaeon]|nr:hypothetical protein [Candidatus Pacearchaeota archaeon]